MLIRTPLPDASLDGVQVDAYRNLRAGGYSLRDRKTGRVVAIVDAVTLRDVKFVVQPAGRARVLATSRKQVHAFVRGTVDAPAVRSAHACTPDELVWLGRCGDCWLSIKYDPRDGVPGFHLSPEISSKRDRVRPLASTSVAALSANGAAAGRHGLRFVDELS